MNTSKSDDLFAPDTAAQKGMLLFAIVCGVLLLIAHKAIDAKAVWFSSDETRTLWYTLAIMIPGLAALTVQRLGDRRFAIGLLGYSVLLGYIAVHTSRAFPAGTDRAIDTVIFPYVWVLIASSHVVSAWFSVWLTRTDFSYPRLFEAAWRHLTTLLQVAAYTGAFWLILFLWGALFKALGITFFDELFDDIHFIYPVTSLIAGYGLVLARTKSSISDVVHLRILALWRGLLPLAAALAITFAAALLIKGVEPLWKTRHATQLLLALVVVLVVLSNAVYGKGGESPLRPLIKRIVQVALALMPLFAGLSAYALSLRWQQYGISVDRLWATLSIAIASVYAVGYAFAALRKQQPWLSGIAPVNRIASVFAAVALLATQTDLLDFRAVTAHILVQRGDALKDEDLRYLRWQLGAPGIAALSELKMQRIKSNPQSAESIDHLLAQKNRYMRLADSRPLQYHQPAGAKAPPESLLATLNKSPQDEYFYGDVSGNENRHESWLFELELNGIAPTEWVLVVLPTDSSNRGISCIRIDAYQEKDSAWIKNPVSCAQFNSSEYSTFLAALQSGKIQTVQPQLLDIMIGTKRIHFNQYSN